MAKKEYYSIGLLVIALAIVLVLINVLRMNTAFLINQVPELPNGADVGMLDSTYVNKVLAFMVSAPNDNWEVQTVLKTNDIPVEDSLKTVAENTIPVLEMHFKQNDTLQAVIYVGVMQYLKDYTPKRLAIQWMGEIFKKYHRLSNRVTVPQAVEKATFHTVPGADFVIVLPESAGDARPVWVCAVGVRKKYAYLFQCKTTEAFYPKIKSDFEKAINNIRALPLPEDSVK